MEDTKNNMPTVVDNYNKYFRYNYGSKQAEGKHYIYVECMSMNENDNDDSCYIIFTDTDNELQELYNSASLIARSMEVVVIFNTDNRKIILNPNTTFEEMTGQLELGKLKMLKQA